MIEVGVAGFGPHWERYRPLLMKLRQPIEVRAVYDLVPARARQVSTEQSATQVTGLRSLARRTDLDALLLLDAGWVGLTGLRLLAAARLPIFVASWLPGTHTDLKSHHEAATHAGMTLMPALWRRYLPASLRLQELVATDLGRPRSVRLELAVGPDLPQGRLTESLVGWMDYCRNLLQIWPTGVEVRPGGPGDQILDLVVTYPRRDTTGQPCGESTATLRLIADDSATPLYERLRRAIVPCPRATGTVQPEDRSVPEITVICEHGSATILNRSELIWQQHGETGNASHSERLTSERCEEEILLDLFCRRVAGGLIPVADFRDIAQPLSLLEAAFPQS